MNYIREMYSSLKSYCTAAPLPPPPSISVKIVSQKNWDGLAHKKFEAAVLKAKTSKAEKQIFKKIFESPAVKK